MTEQANPGYFILSPQVLVDCIPLPAGTEIIGARWDGITRRILVFVKHPDLFKMEEGLPLFKSEVIVTQHTRKPEPGDWIVTYTSKWHP